LLLPIGKGGTVLESYLNDVQDNIEDKKISEDKKRTSEKKEPEGIHFKHKKHGTSIYLTIYNNNNLANDGGNAGVKQSAETGGQIAGKGGENANQGGQIADECGQNANQDGKVKSRGCGQKAKRKHTFDVNKHCKKAEDYEDMDD
jgi:hypothetical protein